MIPLEDVYPWLVRFENSHISPSSDQIISRLKTSLGKEHPERNKTEIRGLFRQIKDLAGNLRDNQEVAEIFIACAYHAYKAGDLVDAEVILEDAVSRSWSNIHNRAVVYWMLGCVQWQSSKDRQQAVISWRNSVSDFERLARQPDLLRDRQVWYQDAWWKTNQSLLQAVKELADISDKDELPEKSEMGSSASFEQTPMSQLPQESAATIIPDTLQLVELGAAQTFDTLQLFTVSEEIPAGDFGPGGMDPVPVGAVELKRLSIDGRPFSIHGTRGRGIIKLPLDQKMALVKVKGDAMNLENITELDYVLVSRVDTPANGDIVMSEIVGVDKIASLRRYFKEENTVLLQPHSNNSAHKTYAFKKDDDGFYIRGVVIAVLKPIKMRLT